MPPAPVPVPAPIKVPQVFAQALELHKQGRLAEAEQLYSEVLAHRPDHFDALQMLSTRLAETRLSPRLRVAPFPVYMNVAPVYDRWTVVTGCIVCVLTAPRPMSRPTT